MADDFLEKRKLLLERIKVRLSRRWRTYLIDPEAFAIEDMVMDQVEVGIKGYLYGERCTLTAEDWVALAVRGMLHQALGAELAEELGIPAPDLFTVYKRLRPPPVASEPAILSLRHAGREDTLQVNEEAGDDQAE